MKLVTVESYPNAAEAHAARSRLESAGVRATIIDESAGTMLWYIGAVGGIKLQVNEDDLTRARELLGNPVIADVPAWKCPHCGHQVDAGFDVCWSCGMERPAETQPDPVPSDESGRSDPLDESSADPAIPIVVGATVAAPINVEAERIVNRAWRAAVLGLGILPGILHLYSLWLLLGGAITAGQLSREVQRTRRWTLLLDVAGIILGIVFFRHIVHGF